MSDEEKDLEKNIKSMRELQGKTLEAMTRLKETNVALENRVKVLEVEIPGLTERQENLEKLIHMLVKDAPKNLEGFLDKAVVPGNEAEAKKDGAALAEALTEVPPTEDEGENEDPSAEVVGG